MEKPNYSYENLERCIGCYQCVLTCARIIEKVLSVDRSSIQVKTVGGFFWSLSVSPTTRSKEHPGVKYYSCFPISLRACCTSNPTYQCNKAS